MNQNLEMKPIVELLSRLVACPSVNPNNQPFNGPPLGEGALAELLAELLRSWGAEVAVRDVLPRRPNLVARFRGRDSRRSLLLEAHSDTVAVEDMSIPPFEPRIVDGKLYGRGACDDKGPMAALLLALKRVLDEDGRPPTDVWFASTCNEERGGQGAAHLLKEGFHADAAVVAEPTDLEIVHAHKGLVRWRIRTHGVAAHSSTPHLGANAIAMMARVVERINGPVAAAVAKKQHALLGRPAISIGTIRGGTQVNVVPALCEIEVDRRLLPGETNTEATREVTQALDELQRADEKFLYSYDEIEHYPPLEEDPQGLLARVVAAACTQVVGRAAFAVAPWGANSGFFKAAGIPSLLFGPGSIRQAHTKDEYIELAQVETAVRVYAEIIRGFGKAPS